MSTPEKKSSPAEDLSAVDADGAAAPGVPQEEHQAEEVDPSLNLLSNTNQEEEQAVDYYNLDSNVDTTQAQQQEQLQEGLRQQGPPSPTSHHASSPGGGSPDRGSVVSGFESMLRQLQEGVQGDSDELEESVSDSQELSPEEDEDDDGNMNESDENKFTTEDERNFLQLAGMQNPQLVLPPGTMVNPGGPAVGVAPPGSPPAPLVNFDRFHFSAEDVQRRESVLWARINELEKELQVLQLEDISQQGGSSKNTTEEHVVAGGAPGGRRSGSLPGDKSGGRSSGPKHAFDNADEDHALRQQIASTGDQIVGVDPMGGLMSSPNREHLLLKDQHPVLSQIQEEQSGLDQDYDANVGTTSESDLAPSSNKKAPVMVESNTPTDYLPAPVYMDADTDKELQLLNLRNGLPRYAHRTKMSDLQIMSTDFGPAASSGGPESSQLVVPYPSAATKQQGLPTTVQMTTGGLGSTTVPTDTEVSHATTKRSEADQESLHDTNLISSSKAAFGSTTTSSANVVDHSAGPASTSTARLRGPPTTSSSAVPTSSTFTSSISSLMTKHDFTEAQTFMLNLAVKAKDEAIQQNNVDRLTVEMKREKQLKKYITENSMLKGQIMQMQHELGSLQMVQQSREEMWSKTFQDCQKALATMHLHHERLRQALQIADPHAAAQLLANEKHSISGSLPPMSVSGVPTGAFIPTPMLSDFTEGTMTQRSATGTSKARGSASVAPQQTLTGYRGGAAGLSALAVQQSATGAADAAMNIAVPTASAHIRRDVLVQPSRGGTSRSNAGSRFAKVLATPSEHVPPAGGFGEQQASELNTRSFGGPTASSTDQGTRRSANVRRAPDDQQPVELTAEEKQRQLDRIISEVVNSASSSATETDSSKQTPGADTGAAVDYQQQASASSTPQINLTGAEIVENFLREKQDRAQLRQLQKQQKQMQKQQLLRERAERQSYKQQQQMASMQQYLQSTMMNMNTATSSSTYSQPLTGATEHPHFPSNAGVVVSSMLPTSIQTPPPHSYNMLQTANPYSFDYAGAGGGKMNSQQQYNPPSRRGSSAKEEHQKGSTRSTGGGYRPPPLVKQDSVDRAAAEIMMQQEEASRLQQERIARHREKVMKDHNQGGQKKGKKSGTGSEKSSPNDSLNASSQSGETGEQSRGPATHSSESGGGGALGGDHSAQQVQAGTPGRRTNKGGSTSNVATTPLSPGQQQRGPSAAFPLGQKSSTPLQQAAASTPNRDGRSSTSKKPLAPSSPDLTATQRRDQLSELLGIWAVNNTGDAATPENKRLDIAVPFLPPSAYNSAQSALLAQSGAHAKQQAARNSRGGGSNNPARPPGGGGGDKHGQGGRRGKPGKERGAGNRSYNRPEGSAAAPAPVNLLEMQEGNDVGGQSSYTDEDGNSQADGNNVQSRNESNSLTERDRALIANFARLGEHQSAPGSSSSGNNTNSTSRHHGAGRHNGRGRRRDEHVSTMKGASSSSSDYRRVPYHGQQGPQGSSPHKKPQRISMTDARNQEYLLPPHHRQYLASMQQYMANSNPSAAQQYSNSNFSAGSMLMNQHEHAASRQAQHMNKRPKVASGSGHRRGSRAIPGNGGNSAAAAAQMMYNQMHAGGPQMAMMGGSYYGRPGGAGTANMDNGNRNAMAGNMPYPPGYR
ncbi:unnamed protein product [Amoebophrya sp. A120]|nr:unnamed protein product [Amoebophrya sp. A120]|eukprot:GSA120T00010311001.1